LRAVELNPELLEAHLNLGNFYFKINLLADSASHYKKVIEINPDYGQVYNNLAVVSFYQEKYSKAYEYLKKAEELGVKVHPDFKKEVLRKLKEKKKK
jgi:tetratricopeptide (TPR) repeat protein